MIFINLIWYNTVRGDIVAKIEFTPKGVCSSKIIVSCDENDVIKDVKKAVKIPVIGNGDI